MTSTFTGDAVHYFVDHEPVAGAQALAHYWSVVGPRTGADRHIDHALLAGDEAVVEWSHALAAPGCPRAGTAKWHGVVRVSRRAHREIRSYHANHRLADPRNAALRGFPYRERGYRILEGT